MRSRIVVLGIFLFVAVMRVSADDIEAYLPAAEADGIYVHVLLDMGDSDRDAVLCTLGLDCAPPFMTAIAHEHLQDIYSVGDAVNAAGMFRAVLSAVLENSLFDDMHLSLLISNHQANVAKAMGYEAGGGTILKGYQRLRDSRTEFIDVLKSIPRVSSGTSHSLQSKEAYFEWMRYLRGGAIALGTNTSGNFGLTNPVPNYDQSIIQDDNYLAPFTNPEDCPRLYSILFYQDRVSRDSDLDAQLATEMSLPDNPSFEQMLTLLHAATTDLIPQLDKPVALQKTWIVASRDQPGNAASLAGSGNSAAVLYVDAPQALQDNLTRSLAELVMASGREAPVSFAADTFALGTALDSLYVPLYLARNTLNWQGNLKKLKFGDARRADGSSGADGVFDRVVDARGNPAFELAGDSRGRLAFDALTFWTEVTSLSPGDDIAIPKKADGRVVRRGGAGQKVDGFVAYPDTEANVVQYFIGDSNSDQPINGFTSRQLYYEQPITGQLKAFNASPEVRAELKPLIDPMALLADEELLDLIRWGRGQDIAAQTGAPRDWILGDILHSQPYALNYGATEGYSMSNPNIRLLVGSGDGIFHILEDTSSRGRETGREVFGFYPAESLRNLKLRREDAISAKKMRYGVDGTPVVLRNDRNGDGTLDHEAGDEAYVYFGLRRGGASYFALDISDPNAVPTLLWKISPVAGGEYETLGLTFSTPFVGKINFSGEPLDVLIFAGGYNGGWNEGYTARRGKDLGAADDSVGNTIFIVNARTGELVWKAVKGDTGDRSNIHYAHAGLVDSIPSTVSPLISPRGIVHRLYVGDTGGALWRVDLPESNGASDNHRREHWFITKLADLGSDIGEVGGTLQDDRRFFHAPDIVHSFDAAGDFDGVLIQSGDRAHPNETVVENYLFYLKDRLTRSGSAVVRAENDVSQPPGRYLASDFSDQTFCQAQADVMTEATQKEICSNGNIENGWKIRFRHPGEKGLSSSLTDAGRVFASTFTPGNKNVCPAQEGQGRVYVVRLEDGAAVANSQRHYDIGAGIPAAPVRVGDAIYLPGTGIDLYDLDRDGERESQKILPSLAAKLYSIYWREPGVDPL